MRYQFKQAAHVNGKDYLLGVHDVSESTEYHPHFLRLVSAGLIVEAENASPVSTDTHQERSQRLLHKIMKRKDPKSAEAAKPKVSEPAPVVVEEQSIDDNEEHEEALVEKKPHAKKKK